MIARNTLLKEESLPIEPRTVIRDCLFLSLIFLLSLILYIQEIGFYSDDWGYIGYYRTSEDQSLPGLYHVLSESRNIKSRPVQAFQQALLYWLFGIHPLGYHLINAGVLLSGLVLFYLVLRELKQGRVLTLVVPLVYGLLPHYSTDRLWFSGFMTSLSMPLYFLSLYADLRVLRTKGSSLWGWKLLSVLGLVGSTLSYEVFMPLFLLNPLLSWYRARQLYGSTQSKRLVQANWAILCGINLFALILVVIFKSMTASRMGTFGLISHIIWFVKLIAKAFIVSYGDYGIGSPGVTSKLLSYYPSWSIIALGAIVGLLVFGYLYLATNHSDEEVSDRFNLVRLIVWGLFIFGMGYAIFLTNTNAIISPTGISNRIALASAVGVALSMVGGIGWVSTFLPSTRLGRRCFCILIALLCTSGFMINNAIASFWIDSYRQQQEIIVDIRQQFPTLPSESTLILDGICPYVGPAVVFESSWDLAGALMIFYGDRNLHADIVTPNMKIEEDGLASIMYGGANYTHHPYSNKLFVYDISKKTTHYLTDVQSARRYFQTFNPDFDNDCPPSGEGLGVKVF
jgi:hypothetical protein